MVKKGSFFDKLKSRWSSSGVRVEPTTDNHNRMREHLTSVPAVPDPARVEGRKLSAREDAMVAVGEGFQELGTLLRGVQTRMEGSGTDVARMAEQLAHLPALGAAQLEMLKSVATALERQNALTERLHGSVENLPQLMGSVQAALERAHAADQRTVRTLDEFKSTMDRIQGSIGEMVETSGRHAAASESQADSAARQAHAVRTLVEQQRQHGQQVVETIEAARAQDQSAVQSAVSSVEQLAKSQTEAAQRMHATQQSGLSALRQANEDQSAKLGRMLAQGQASARTTLVMSVLALVALAAILTVLVIRG